MGTIRFRLTLWYASVFLLTGVLLLVLVYALVGRAFPEQDPRFVESVGQRAGFPALREALGEAGRLPPPRPNGGRPGGREMGFIELLDESRRATRDEALRQLLVQSSLALGLMSVASLGAGWLVAGRMLQPISGITGTVRRIDAGRLHERVALGGPPDELRELADQFDAMLDRLDEAFRAQHDFVANASHELRTPLAVMRTELDVTFANPDATPEEMRASAEVVQRAIGRAEALIAALLTLERADAPAGRLAPVDLTERVRAVLDAHSARVAEQGITVRTTLTPAELPGDAVLLDRLAENLITNAIAYNVPDGWIEASCGLVGGTVTLRVANSGAPVPPEEAEALFERFRRLNASRSRATGGYGLGLAIVRAVARHHRGEAQAHALSGGGLEVIVTLPAA
ncbi:MAG: sensor histidine kinase [Chloroflexi bacterium]|nr:HAMP domain-containing sensor histidine kinase [Chloroflexota bacterium]MDA1240345.1 HAMP domain-containing sensor histidine kinase [Chloroflexota bacterium]MQC19169.1 sensor histidine kinase [Chloroflexota bacterium]